MGRMTIKELIRWGAKELAGLESGRLDAELLLAHTLKKERTHLLAHDDAEISFLRTWRFRRLIAQRKKQVPVAYLLGQKEFYGLEFRVNRHTLIPRPDTEVLVESVIGYLKPADRLLDVGTGTGCIPIAVLKHVPGARAVSTDLSRKALRVAQGNVDRYGLGDRIRLIRSNLLDNVPPELFGEGDLIATANLPYVPDDYGLNEEARHEPSLALFGGGDDGLELYRKLLDQLADLRPKAVFLECYAFQVPLLAERMKGYRLAQCKSMLGEARMMLLEKVKE